MSDNESDYIDVEEESVASTTTASSAPIVGPVSPNPNLSQYSPLYSSSMSSLDGSNEYYSDTELEIQQAIANEMAAADAMALQTWRSGLRTVPATTDLTTSQPHRICPIPISFSPSPSSPFSTSPSTSRSLLIDQRAARMRRLQVLNSYIQDLQDNMPLATRLQRQRRRRRNRRRIVHFQEDEHEERVPPNADAEVLRRGNSISDCSQCSSAEEDAIAIPSHLVEWSYPGPTN